MLELICHLIMQSMLTEALQVLRLWKAYQQALEISERQEIDQAIGAFLAELF